MLYQRKKQASTGILGTIKELFWLLLIVFLIRTFGFGLYQVPTGSMETTMLVGERFFADKFTIHFTDLKRNDIISFNDPLFPYSSNSIIRLYQEYVGWPIWPWGPMNWTKRIIGIPGDHIKGVIEDGKPVVYRNGERLNETYLNQYPLLAVADMECQTIEWRSYVPSMPFDNQPYYRVTPDRVIHPNQLYPETLDYYIKNYTTITPEGMMLQEPGQPIAETDSLKKIEKDGNYWTNTDVFDVKLGKNQYWLMGDNRRGSRDCRFFGPIDRRLIHGKILFRIWSIDSSESWWIVDLIKHPIDFWNRMRWNRFFQCVN